MFRVWIKKWKEGQEKVRHTGNTSKASQPIHMKNYH